MSITKNVVLNWYSSMKTKIEKDSDNFWHRKLTLKVKFWHFLIARHYSNSPNLVILFDYSWFLARNLSNLLSLPWKLHNRYCHTTYSILVVQKLCLLFQKCRIFAMYKCTSGRGTCSSMKSCFCELLSKQRQNNGVTSILKEHFYAFVSTM